jgi:hypothetical protein
VHRRPEGRVYEAARIYHDYWRHGRNLAARGARAAAGDAGDRIFEQRIT